MTQYTRRPLALRGISRAASTIWRGSQSSREVPEDAILTEDGYPILTELGQYILTET